MKFGYFDNTSREYVINNPKTPVKWINYLGTLDFGGFVDHTGGLLICKGDPTLNRITKYLQQAPSSEFKGSTLYVRIKTDAGYKVFSPFFVPTLDEYTSFECHVGMQYTRFVSEFFGIKFDILMFVPEGEAKLITDVRITNASGKPVALDVIPVVEYTHPMAIKQYTNADWVPQTMQSRVHKGENGTKILTQFPFYNRDFQINYLTSNVPASSFESDRKKFLGENEYGTWMNPLSLHADELSNTEANRGDNIGAILHRLGELKNGDKRRIIIQFGQAKSVEAVAASIRKFHAEKEVDASFQKLKDFWDVKFDIMQVETPDTAMNNMLNIFNPYQCFTTLNWSRYLSYYQLGLGSRGIGFRDTSQDSLGVVDRYPDAVKAIIRKLLRVQKTNGSSMHQFNPLSMVGEVGDAAEDKSRPQYYSDDHLWSILAVTDYVKETGDVAFLKEVVPYYDKNAAGEPTETDSVYDHLKRAVEFTRKNTGRHGLPLLGYADWNDTVNLPEGAESLFTASLYGKVLLELGQLAESLNDTDVVRKCRAYYDDVKIKFNECAWDGEWFVRYFDHEGKPLGSNKNKYGQIFLNGQSWPVISGFASREKALQALETVNKRLNTSKGIKLSTPGYNGYDSFVGGISSYPPGAKENGGIFLHTNPWVMIAETLVGNGDRAYAYYNQINPATKNDIIEEFECEPYVYPQNILSDEHPQFGLARNSWLSGTASWVYQASTRYILGVKPTYKGLEINPCIPKKWDGFKVKRRFRGAVYAIDVKNPGHVSTGIKSVTIDGKKSDGAVVPVFGDNKTHEIVIVMG